MKPLYLSFQAFGPYLNRIEIDFQQLNEAAIFLISGPTGGGKTSILDAICFALFCKATGGKRDFKSMRCNIAGDDIPTQVEFCFSLGKKQYRFERRLQTHINRNTKLQNLKDKHACYVRNADETEWILLKSGAERAVRDCAEELLHLDCVQFSQVIVLPQGEFLQFLRGSSEEKGKTLKSLFSAQIWEQIVINASNRQKRLKSQHQEQETIRSSLLNHEGLESTQSLTEAVIAAKEALRANKERAEKLFKEQEIAGKTLEKAREYLHLSKEKETRRRALEVADKQYMEAEKEMKEAGRLKSQQEQLRANATTLAQEAVKMQEQQAQLQIAIDVRKNAKEKFASAEKETLHIRETESAIKKLEQRLKDGQEFLQEARRDVGKLPELTQEEARLVRVAEAQNELEKCLKAEKRLKKTQETLLKNSEEEKLTFRSLSDQLHRQEAIRKHDAAYALAQGLEHDQPCPVCGSLTHPCMAQAGEEVLEEQEYKRLQEMEKKADRKLQQTIVKLERSLEDLAEAQEAVRKQISVCSGFPEESLKVTVEKQEKLSTKLETSRKKEKQIGSAQEKIEKLQKEKDDKVREKSNYEKKVASLIAAAKALEEPYQNERLEIQEALAQNLTQDIANKKKNRRVCEKQAEKLEKQHEAVLRMFSEGKATQEMATEQLKKAEADFKGVQGSWDHPPVLEVLKRAFGDLQRQSKEHAEELGKGYNTLQRLEKTMVSVLQLDESLAKLTISYELTAKISFSLSGTNAYKTPILQYVLSIMLDEILVSANQFFDTLSRGRYALKRITQQQTSSGHRGLDIEVLDGFSMSARSIETLSGGEQFLASLSLAFGLSDVVQQHSGAVKLDALFIDEGFGSLDSETLDIAMRALMVLQEGGRTVGIISHVAELRNRIPVRLEIFRDSTNSAAVKTVLG